MCYFKLNYKLVYNACVVALDQRADSQKEAIGSSSAGAGLLTFSYDMHRKGLQLEYYQTKISSLKGIKTK